jgi:curved DNA-binding protein CbpA
MRRNLYDLLGVRPDDDAEHLRKAFLKAARESHPDHHGDDPEAAARFRQIVEAYDILRDAVQRAAYDRLLAAERGPLCSKLMGAFSAVRRHMVANAIIGVILGVTLAGGYELYAHMSETAVDDGARTTARGPVEIAASKPAGESGPGERNRPLSASAQMPIVLPVENPVAPSDTTPARRTIEVARDDSGSDTQADQAGAKAGPDASAKNRADEPQDRRDAQSTNVQVVQVPAAETPSAPGPTSSSIASFANRPDRGTLEPVGAGSAVVMQTAVSAETEMSVRFHAAMKRLPASRARFRHASLARRHSFSRMHAQYCEGD